MPKYNGLLASLIKGQSGGVVLTGVSYVSAAASVPAKGLNNAIIGVVTSGVSGAYAINIVSGIGGCTYIIAGVSDISANGNVLLSLRGSTESTVTTGTIPRPGYVQFESSLDTAGFTSTVYILGDY